MLIEELQICKLDVSALIGRWRTDPAHVADFSVLPLPRHSSQLLLGPVSRTGHLIEDKVADD